MMFELEGLVSRPAVASCHAPKSYALLDTYSSDLHHWCRVPKRRNGRVQSTTRWVKFENFDLKRVISFGTSHQWCRKFPSRIFYTFWPPYGQKFQFGTFDPKTCKKSRRGTSRITGAEFQSTEVALWRVQCFTPALRSKKVKFENFDLESVFSFGTLLQWCRKFLSRIFYQFLPPYGRKSTISLSAWVLGSLLGTSLKQKKNCTFVQFWMILFLDFGYGIYFFWCRFTEHPVKLNITAALFSFRFVLWGTINVSFA